MPIQVFVLHGGKIRWSNMGRGFNLKLVCRTQNSEQGMWVTKLPSIIPENERLVYVLFEDVINFKPKYWVYEMCIPELICILCEVEGGLADFYIVSKKFNWLISECHEDIVSFVGNSLNLECFESS